METIISHTDADNIDMSVIERAGRIIREGGIVAFPTETVYGLGGDALRAESSAKIYEAKGRPSDNPLIVHIAEEESLKALVKDIPESARILIDRYWPGPLTIIFDRSDIVPLKTTGGLDTVAVRFPSDPVARKFIKASGGYIAAPSANLSGKPSPTRGEYVIEDLDGRVDMIITGDDSHIGLESTIVDVTGDVPVILRPGIITYEELKELLGDILIDPAIKDAPVEGAEALKPKAPGMKYRHYAPKGRLEIIKGSASAVISYINERLMADREKGLKTGVIAADERADNYSADLVLSTGPEKGSEEAAHRLFTILRKMDDAGIESIYAEAREESGIDAAYMNRLKKAAGYKITEL